MNTEVLIVASPGGHLNVAKQLELDKKFVCYFVTNRKKGLSWSDEPYSVRTFNRNLSTIGAFYDALRILKKYKPKIIVSTGAGIAVPFFYLGLFTGAKLIFIESASRTETLSLSGKLLKPVCTKFYVRDHQLSKKVNADEFR